ncbi:hypothetical protein L5515_016919 [Caenorhabditis briggsae]|uniref:Uncharacterized protein n=1 Tax=Caenorhabditis briggsae TaxID=6238 RepID=A0AAE9FCU8_CAEBR|nr:hypothetical protein L5515_016919 [Caenorhabditis briggsae]
MSGKKVATHSKAKNESTPGKRTPAKRPIDKEDQNSTPKRRRCLSIKRNIHPESSEDPNKTAPLDELVPDREKIPLPVTLNVIETVDLRIQHLTPLCAPICPANVPLDTIVKDFLVHKKFISPNQKATPQKITHHAWGISEMVRIFNENIRSHVLTTSEIKEFDKKRANASKRTSKENCQSF